MPASIFYAIMVSLTCVSVTAIVIGVFIGLLALKKARNRHRWSTFIIYSMSILSKSVILDENIENADNCLENVIVIWDRIRVDLGESGMDNSQEAFDTIITSNVGVRPFIVKWRKYKEISPSNPTGKRNIDSSKEARESFFEDLKKLRNEISKKMESNSFWRKHNQDLSKKLANWSYEKLIESSDETKKA